MASSNNRKPRGDSRLKTLPPERQRAIFEKMQTCTLAEAVKWLRDDGFETSDGALSEFGSWYGLKQRFTAAEDTSQHFVEMLKQADFGMSADQLLEAGNLMFIAQATQANDAETFINLGKLLLAKNKGKLNSEKLKLDERKLKLLEAKAAKADAADAVNKDSSLSPEAYREKMRSIFNPA